MCLFTKQIWLRKAKKPLKGYKFVIVEDDERFSPFFGTAAIPSPCLSGEQCYEPKTKSRLEFDYDKRMFVANGGFIHFYTDIIAAKCSMTDYVLQHRKSKVELWEIQVPKRTKYALGSHGSQYWGPVDKESIYWGTCGVAHAIKFVKKINMDE